MQPKVTIIGAAPAEGPVPAGEGVGAGGVKPTVMFGQVPSPAPTPTAPTVFKPTAMAGTAPQKAPAPATPAPVRVTPTAMPFGAPVEAAIEPAREPIRPVALPGVQNKGLDVSPEELAGLYPQYEPEVRQRAQGVLAGFYLSSANPSTFLVFGKEAQEELAAIVRKRMAWSQRPDARAVPQYLQRLQGLLQEVLDSFEGGFLRKSPDKVWAEHHAEIRQLEQLLDAADDVLASELVELGNLKKETHAAAVRLSGVALAAEYLTDKVQADHGGLMVARLGSLTASQALARDQEAFLENDIGNLQELMVLVQDGVVLKLPAVYSQLAGVTGRFNDTQRFQATERLSEILHTLKKRKTQ